MEVMKMKPADRSRLRAHPVEHVSSPAESARAEQTASSQTVVYPGREGAHSALACEALFPSGSQIRPLPSFRSVVEAVAGATADFGVLPIESSLSGSVAETHDLLVEWKLSIVRQTILPIRHYVLAPQRVSLRRIRVIRSHPVALDQCRRLLASMPWATAIAAATTADAAADVAERGDPTEAAIASEWAAARFGLEVIAEEVGDHAEAYTRFVAVAGHTSLERGEGLFRTAVSFVPEAGPSGLQRALAPFAGYGVPLVELVSRPVVGSPWQYRFDAVFDGHVRDGALRAALREVIACTKEVIVVGSYPQD
jgi:chorismate mutase/prephenate dehydratase